VTSEVFDAKVRFSARRSVHEPCLCEYFESSANALNFAADLQCART
jgi:hypothetical protein